MEAKAADVHTLYRAYTACPEDVPWVVIDVRPHKEFKKSHLVRAYCIRLSANGAALLDYSKASYDLTWSNGCWWGKQVIIYGPSGLKKDNDVVNYLTREGQCKTLFYFKEGFEEFEKCYPFLCTTSIKGGAPRCPSQILPGLLYLGDWSNAEGHDTLAGLKVRSIITIHNNPERLKLPAGVKHLRFELPDIDTADISVFFNPTFEAVEEARHKKYAVLVHCGAGVSRSATLAMSYLMRRFTWSAAAARQHCRERRSLVCPNDGFWRTLCALEGPLGIKERSDPSSTFGGAGLDAPPQDLGLDVVGGKVGVHSVSARELKRQREAAGASTAADGEEAKRSRGAGVSSSREEAAAGAAGQRPGHTARAATGTSTGGVSITFEVMKPEGRVGELVVGPMSHTQRAVIGRAPGSDVFVEHLSISRAHASLTADMRGTVFITDLSSGHGTKLDDVWIKAEAPKPLRVGSRLSFGASTRVYKVLTIAKS